MRCPTCHGDGWFTREAREQVTSPSLAAALLLSKIGKKRKEHFVAIHLNTRKQVERLEIVSIGTLNAAPAHPREIFREAIRRGTHSLILGHNHPSGEASPSLDDIKISKALQKAGDLVGIPVLDSLIVSSSGDWVSLKERGDLS